MNKFSSLFVGAALTFSMGACTPDVDDPFDSLTTTNGDGDGDGDTTGDGDGDGDGDPTTTGDGDGDGDGDPTTTGDGDGDPACGGFDEACCAGTMCDAGLSCEADGTCGLGDPTTGDGDGDTGGFGDGPYYGSPGTCQMDEVAIMVGMLTGGFCSAMCINDECPPAPAGSNAQAACALDDGMGGAYCALICQVGSTTCPEGATCEDLMDAGNPGIGLCTYIP